MPLSAAIFRRGGPKKELFDNEDGGEDVEQQDRQELSGKLAEVSEVLKAPKTG